MGEAVTGAVASAGAAGSAGPTPAAVASVWKAARASGMAVAAIQPAVARARECFGFFIVAFLAVFVCFSYYVAK